MPDAPNRPPKRASALTAGGAALIALSGVALLAPASGNASSHREAPLVAAAAQVDNTDTYAFVSPDKPDTVTLIANWIPFEEPNGGPNFYPFAENARYNIKVDNDGDGNADVTYAWTFTNHYKTQDTFLYNTGPVSSISDKTLNFTQTYTLTRTAGKKTTTLLSNAVVAPSDTGKASFPDYKKVRDEAIKTLPGGGTTFAGQADDPFFLDLRVFDLLYGANLKEAGHDTLNGYNVNTIALQVPAKDLVLKGDSKRNPVIGVWSTTDRKSSVVYGGGAEKASGDYVQVSRLGNPLVNEVVVPVKYKDAFNSINPATDHTIAPVVAKVTDPEVPKLIQGIYKIPAPAAPRNDLVEIFLTGICKACGPIKADLNSQMLNKDVKAKAFVPSEELRLNVAVPPTASPNRLGVIGADLAGFPNGRRLTDDVIDIALQAVEGAAQTGKIVEPLKAGDAVDQNDVAFDTTFPYLALPHEASVNENGGTAANGATTSSSDGSSATASPTAGAKAGFGGAAHRNLLLGAATLLTGSLMLGLGAVSRRRTGVLAK
ncbi:MAG: hypothetical protein QOK42_1707 [Frankiaceae bacterium]|jgi:hypothetical protein|nr:hypothetical protein [Frankiaceae bacterium]MDX6226080.1 hypothetical protein [Frankiales bacterium]